MIMRYSELARPKIGRIYPEASEVLSSDLYEKLTGGGFGTRKVGRYQGRYDDSTNRVSCYCHLLNNSSNS
jgi:hypothetical protein